LPGRSARPLAHPAPAPVILARVSESIEPDSDPSAAQPQGADRALGSTVRQAEHGAAPSGWARSTLAVTAGRPPRAADAPTSHPVTLAATFVAGGDIEYGRYGNPTWTAFEDAVGALENGRALAFSSGVAAIDAVLSLLPDGAVIVGPDSAYPGTADLMNERVSAGTATFRPVPVADTSAVTAALSGADLVWLESPTNPNLDVADIAAIADAARAACALLAVDNTFSTPILQRPLDLGADMVVHSATKLLSGHSDVVLGVAVTRDDDLFDRMQARRRRHGSIPGPMETWLALRGLRTLALRVERGEDNARSLAGLLAEHTAVSRVRYPGRGTMLSIELTGGADAADLVAAAVRLWLHATSLGGVESSLERRRRWPSESAQVSPALLRLSVGIEDIDDLWADLRAALDAAPSST
jgi:cystathionine gamma-synthase